MPNQWEKTYRISHVYKNQIAKELDKMKKDRIIESWRVSGSQTCTYLGHKIAQGEMLPEEIKIAAIIKWICWSQRRKYKPS